MKLCKCKKDFFVDGGYYFWSGVVYGFNEGDDFYIVNECEIGFWTFWDCFLMIEEEEPEWEDITDEFEL